MLRFSSSARSLSLTFGLGALFDAGESGGVWPNIN